MTFAANINASFSGVSGPLQEYFPSQNSLNDYSPAVSNQLTDDYQVLVRRQIDNRLLNTQACIEYEQLKARILSGVAETNKFLDPDDQIIVRENKNCLSLYYRQQLFVMEFRQITSSEDQCNHALDLIFRSPNTDFHTTGRTTLVLSREHNQFVWCQFHALAGSPAGTSKTLASLVLRWLQNDRSLFLRLSQA